MQQFIDTLIKNNSSTLSREWFYDKFGESIVTRSTFVNLAGKRKAFNPNIAARDIKRLERASKKIRLLCNRTVAHTLSKPKPKVTFDEVNKCLKVYEEVLGRYSALLTGSGQSYLPISTSNWEWIFTQAWV